jgi:hypothetical protein
MQLSTPYTDHTTFDFHDAPSLDGTSMGFGGEIEHIDLHTWRLTWNDGIVNEWSEDLPSWHAAHAYLGHLMDFVFRGATFEQTCDEWLLANWFTSGADWARWHYRHLIGDLQAQDIDRDRIDVEDMGGGQWAVLVRFGEDDLFAWIDDVEDLDGKYRCYLYGVADGAMTDSIDGYTTTDRGAIALIQQWDRSAEDEALGAVLAQLEDLELDARQRVLVEALHQINQMIREEN